MSSAVKSSQLIGITLVLYLSDNCTANSLASGEDGLAQFNKMIKGLLIARSSLTTRSSAFT